MGNNTPSHSMPRSIKSICILFLLVTHLFSISFARYLTVSIKSQNDFNHTSIDTLNVNSSSLISDSTINGNPHNSLSVPIKEKVGINNNTNKSETTSNIKRHMPLLRQQIKQSHEQHPNLEQLEAIDKQQQNQLSLKNKAAVTHQNEAEYVDNLIEELKDKRSLEEEEQKTVPESECSADEEEEAKCQNGGKCSIQHVGNNKIVACK